MNKINAIYLKKDKVKLEKQVKIYRAPVCRVWHFSTRSPGGKGKIAGVLVCIIPGGGGYSHCGLTGGSSQFEGLTNWLPNGPFCQPHTTN